MVRAQPRINNLQIPCESGLFPSKKKVKPISIFDPGIDSCVVLLSLFVQVVTKILESSFVFNLHCVTNLFYCFVGDDVRWYPPKEGWHANDLLSSRAICGSQNFENNSFRIMNKGDHDLENFFSSKWPDLRTNRLQEGGYDVISIASCCGTTRCYHDWPKHEGPKCKMKLNLSSTSSILVFPSSI